MKIPESFKQPLSTSFPKVYKVLTLLGVALLAVNLYAIFTGLYSAITRPNDPSFFANASLHIPMLNLKMGLLVITFLVGLLIIIREIRCRVHFALLGWQVTHFSQGAFRALDAYRLRTESVALWFHFFFGFAILSIVMYSFFCRIPAPEQEAT